MSVATVEFYLFHWGQELTIETLMATSDPRPRSRSVRNRVSVWFLEAVPPHPPPQLDRTLPPREWMDNCVRMHVWDKRGGWCGLGCGCANARLSSQ